jgi:peptidoglycan/LPS O-acetylase OafA/YrhL
MFWIILAGEIMFWVFVVAGLVCRYVFQKKRIGKFLLWCTPLIDLVILLFTVMDLKNGATANIFHGLAAIYIGVSIVFGKSMIDWADKRFAYRYNQGPKPQKAPKYGKIRARNERRGWFMHLFAWLIGCGLLAAMIWLVGDESKTAHFSYTIRLWSIILGIDFLVSFSYTIWPKEREKANRES